MIEILICYLVIGAFAAIIILHYEYNKDDSICNAFESKGELYIVMLIMGVIQTIVWLPFVLIEYAKLGVWIFDITSKLRLRNFEYVGLPDECPLVEPEITNCNSIW